MGVWRMIKGTTSSTGGLLFIAVYVGLLCLALPVIKLVLLHGQVGTRVRNGEIVRGLTILLLICVPIDLGLCGLGWWAATGRPPWL